MPTKWRRWPCDRPACFCWSNVLPVLGRHIDNLCPQQRILEIGLCVVGILRMRGKDQWHFDPVIVPLDLALEAPLLGHMHSRGVHSLMFSIHNHALRKFLATNRRSRAGCRYLVCRGRRRNAWLRRPCGRMSLKNSQNSEQEGCVGLTGRPAAFLQLSDSASLCSLRQATTRPPPGCTPAHSLCASSPQAARRSASDG